MADLNHWRERRTERNRNRWLDHETGRDRPKQSLGFGQGQAAGYQPGYRPSWIT